MFQLIETIRIEGKKLQNIYFHNARWNAARMHYFNTNELIKIEDLVNIPDTIDNSIYKCRITDDGTKIKYTITPYEFRIVNTLKIVNHETIQYQFKTSEREHLNQLFEQRANCDDVLIFRNNLLTDSWVANVLLFDGTNWLTPKQPLLKGVQRAVLLTEGKIQEADIQKEDLANFKKIKLINAMVNFKRAASIPIENIQK